MINGSEKKSWDFPGGPVVKNWSCNAGDASSIPGWETRIPCAVGQLSPHAATREPACHNQGARVLPLLSPCTLEPVCHNQRARVLQLMSPHALEPMHHNQREACASEVERSSCTTTKSPHAATKTQRSQRINKQINILKNKRNHKGNQKIF